MRLINAEPYAGCRIVANRENSGVSIDEIKTVDAVPVVRCKNCVHWQKPYIELNGGGRRDYADGEGFVRLSVGTNVGSYCTLVDDVTVHGFRDGMPSVDKTMLWRSETDFCSRGERSFE